MGKILFEHNDKAYRAAVSMLEETGRAAIIHPTGTGKSFIAFQLCADHTESRFCFLSPSEHIFKTQQEKWMAAGGAHFQNLKFFTYARLMRMEEDELADIQADYIILDEFHRCGAAQWGGGVARLRERYPEAKILGLSATNIRYLDNQRDMAWELFGGNIASELTLGAAVAGGILPAPKYVLSIYSYQKELKRYEARVQQTKNKAVRDTAEKELAALRRALEKADGLADVFARHMQMEEKNCGKYIVFCASYDHLCEMQQLAPEWFAKVDPAPHIYSVYSDDPASSGEFEAFKADGSRHLKLLYCIDMLNEGIHVDGVDGVILLRPTVSPTIYKQQIGRALAAGKKKSPVIFDIVMNIENLCSIGGLEEELQQAILQRRAGGGENALIGGHFQVMDELGDCRKLFAKLTETLGASWEAMYEKAREYYAGHGDLEVPATYVTAEGYSLGAWIGTQRKVHAGKVAGCLGEAQVARLTAIGMRWQPMQEAAWERNFTEAKHYYREHGNLSIPKRYTTGNGRKLGIWLQRQRMGRRRSQLEQWQIAQLDGIGMVWEMEEPWETGFCHAQEYFRANGNLAVPNGYVCGDGYRLGKWISNQRSAYAALVGDKQDGRGGNGKENGGMGKLQMGERGRRVTERKKISPEQIGRLEEIGMVWNAKVGRPGRRM